MLPTTPTSISTTTAIVTPFPTQVLTSSPSDFTTLQAANSILNHMVENEQLLPIPARKFIRCLTSASEKLFARTSLLQEQTEAQEALLAKWKQRELVKDSLIKGKGLISTPEIYAAKVKSERNSKKKRQKCTAHTLLC